MGRISTLAVAEVFGPTFQGEGASAGHLAAFVRLGGCNLACSWCDTPYTWDWTGKNGKQYDPRAELQRMTVDEIASRIENRLRPGNLVVVTGGEPLLQQTALLPLLHTLSLAGYWLEIETNGTVAPAPHVASYVRGFNVSPKLANSGNGPERIVPAALRAFVRLPNARFKFVCRAPDDLAEVRSLVEEYDVPRERVWIMPEGTSPGAVLAGLHKLAAAALDAGFNLSTRLHVLLWGNQRGV